MRIKLFCPVCAAAGKIQQVADSNGLAGFNCLACGKSFIVEKHDLLEEQPDGKIFTRNFLNSITEHEKAAPSFLDWGNERPGQKVRFIAASLEDEKGTRAVMLAGAFKVIAGVMRDTRAEELEHSLADLKITIRSNNS